MTGATLTADRRAWYGAALIAAVGLISYFNSFAAPFVYDGAPFVRDNSAIHSPWRIDRIYAFSPARWGGYWTFSLNYAAHGTRVWGYHAVNTAIHLACGCLLFGIVRRTLGLRTVAFSADRADATALTTALLWIAHPLATQAVTNLYQRLESLASLLVLSTVYSFIRAFSDGKQHRGWAVTSVVCCWLGTTVKEVSGLVPFIVIAYDYVYLRPEGTLLSRRRYYACLFFAVPLTLIGLYFQSRHFVDGGILIVENLSPWDYLCSQPEVLLHYLRLVVWPVDLCFDYAWPKADDWGRIAAAGAVVLTALGFTLSGLLRARPWSVPAVAFFLILAPTSSLIPIVDLAVEHRMYLPSAFVLLGLVLLVDYVRRRCERPSVFQSFKPATVLAFVAVIGLTVTTVRRNRVYESEYELWSDVLRVAPHNARAHANLGVQLKQRRDYVAAEKHLREALQLDPRAALAHYNLGALYFVQRRYAESETHLERAAELRPHDSLNLSALGMLRGVQERYAESEQLFRDSLAIDPANLTTQKYLQTVLQAASAAGDRNRMTPVGHP